MPSLYEAYWRHANLYLSTLEGADQLFSKESTQEKGISIFDQNQEQIERALEWITHQNPSSQSDILLAQFVDAFSSIGMVRYSVRDKLIPLNELKIAAAQRLSWKDLEADSLDEQGILYAFLGYLQQAMQHFEMANSIADQIEHNVLKRDIQKHIRLAQKQMKKEDISPSVKSLSVIRIVFLQLRLLFAMVNKNPFIKITTLKRVADNWMVLRKWNLAISYYQKAILISQEHAYRFGELEAAMGLLQAQLLKDDGKDIPLSAGRLSNLASDFEWKTDLSVFETLLEIAPIISIVESIANQLEQTDDPRAIEIYRVLDHIMLRTNEIVEAVNEKSTRKHEIFLSALHDIKGNLDRIMLLSSSINS